jgi:diguanylate cyclase (GGDEF)-like protein
VVVLTGAVSSRPEGLERDLLRAGFQVVEAPDPGAIPGRPALVLHCCSNLTPDCAELVNALASARPTGAQLVAILPNGTADDLLRAASSGADEVILPGDASVMMARLWARVLSPRNVGLAPGGKDLRLFEILQQVATELHRDEMLHALVRGLAHALDLRSVSCLFHSEHSESGRLVAASDAPKVRDDDASLDRWPEAVMAMRRGETVYLRNVAIDPMFVPVPGRTAASGPPPDLDSVAAIPLAPMGRQVGTLVLRTRRGEPPLMPAQVSFAEFAVAATARLLDTEDRRAAIARRQAIAAHVDPLTGCGTLDALDRRIREEFERARRYTVNFALVLLDVDAMRTINDRLGRDGGHRVLADLGRLLQRELRGPDFVARYGGEEFLLLLPETDLEGARGTVRRIRDQMASVGLGELQLGVRCRLTAGVVTFPHPGVHKPEDLFALVEAALLDGKSQEIDRIGSAA